jgi:hypothetical protein
MKKNLVVLLGFICCFSAAFSQHNVFSAGSSQTLTITGGTLFSADSLVLVPSANFTVASNALLETPVPVIGNPSNSILRVYYLNNPINFTGTIKIYYRLTELNGNTENTLQYSDSTTGSWWLVSAASTVNTTSHYVQFLASNELFVAATATEAGTVLPLKLLSFSGSINGNDVDLSWTIAQNEQSKSFIVQSSADEESWQDLNNVPGSMAPGTFQYYYDEVAGALSTKLYRIMITSLSGQVIYSPIIRIAAETPPNSAYVFVNNSEATIYFTGTQPKNIRVMNGSGQTIYRNNVSNNRYEIDNLLPGLYIAQYELNGTVAIKKFVVR